MPDVAGEAGPSGPGWHQVGTLTGDDAITFTSGTMGPNTTSSSATYTLTGIYNYTWQPVEYMGAQQAGYTYTTNWQNNTVNGVPHEEIMRQQRALNFADLDRTRISPEAVEAAREAQRAREQEFRRVSEERQRERHTATERATALLMSMLDTGQRQDYEATGSFTVTGSLGNLYRIHPGSVGNVGWLDPQGAEQGRLCAHPDMYQNWLPDADVAVAQMLALTTDEPQWVRIANVSRGRRPVLEGAT